MTLRLSKINFQIKYFKDCFGRRALSGQIFLSVESGWHTPITTLPSKIFILSSERNSLFYIYYQIGELLLSHAGSDELKICDFGLSRRIQFGKHASLDYGMPEFVAPEIASGEGVDVNADMWSVGIITYILLSGHSPFKGIHDRETLTRVREG